MSAQQILVVDDEADIRTLIDEILSDEGYEVQTAADAESARASLHRESPDLVLLDIWMPDTDGITLLKEWHDKGDIDCPVVIMSGHGTVETAVEATRLGAVDFIEKPLSLAKLLRTVESALRYSRGARQNVARSLIPPMIAPVGKSRKIREAREQAEHIAPHAAPVLITGEPGSGREAFARYIHARSDRGDKPFVTVVGGVTTDETATSMLLGTEFGGQIQRGFIEQASEGTLFVKDLDDLSPEAQRILLGVIEQQSFSRLGGSEQIPVKLRLIASVRHDPEQSLRPDLQARFSVLQLRVPALAEYTEDVPELLRYFVDKLVDAHGLEFRRFGVAAQNRLRNYPWPGNLREMSNLVERLLIAGGDETIGLEELEQALRPAAPERSPLVKPDLLALPLREAREQFERSYLKQQLSLCHGKVGLLAKRVGMERTHLYRKLRSLGVEFGSDD